MSDPAELRSWRVARDDLELRQAKPPCPQLNRFFYTAVGAEWRWVDRFPWTLDQWQQYATRPNLETWVLYVSGTPAGYFELDGEPRSDIEIAYFGLIPQFIGQGLGAYLLTEATRRAWAKKATRVWVHTSSLDHPNALPNYRARGFRLFKEEVSFKDLPGRSTGGAVSTESGERGPGWKGRP